MSPTKHLFKSPEQYVPGDILIPKAIIQKRIAQLAQEIAEKNINANLLLLGILTGAAWFTVDFSTQLYECGLRDTQVAFLKLSSYTGTTSGYEPKLEYDSSINPSGRNVMVVDDVIDTGKSLQFVKTVIHGHGVRTYQSIVLLDKPAKREVRYVPEYVGFTIPDIWVQGYGMDTDGYGRSQMDIIKGPFRD